MLAYLLLQLAATEKANPPPPQFICWNGATVYVPSQCPNASPPPPHLPASVRPVPRGNPGSWVSTNDYPSRSLMNGVEGTTGFKLRVGSDGRVLDCQIISSSGDPGLDSATCSNITRRARFHPALDNNRNPVEGTYSNRVRWQIPVAPSYFAQIDELLTSPTLLGSPEISGNDYPAISRSLRQGGNVIVAIDVSNMGRVRACAVRESSGFPVLDAQSCILAKRSNNYAPAYDKTGKPVGGKVILNFVWIPPKIYDVNGQLIPAAEPPIKPVKDSTR